MGFTAPQRTIGEGIDRLVSIEITGRGVIGELYAAARAAAEGPLCLEAAGRLLQRVHKGSVVILSTGLPTYPWFAGEQDGPVGTATLARALVLAVGARPVIVTDPVNLEICAAAVRGAGLYTRSVEDALQLPTTAAILPFPIDWNEAVERSRALLDQLRPAALIAIERPGANEHGHYHSAGGRRLTDHCGKVDALFKAARDRELLTIGVGDGGNEVGCAAIRETVLRVVPNGAKCACPCGGSVVPTVEIDFLVAAAISNWGAYGIEAAMAVLLERPEVLHSREIDARVHDLCTAAGANNDGPGLLDVGADAVPGALHGHIVELLGQMVRSGIDFGRLYREPRYPWF
ncbi:MAG TPA: glutamate cyclase domain-containing protein [bacterium]|nr:glutamate cyclase domain-containing protein [bacterium]